MCKIYGLSRARQQLKSVHWHLLSTGANDINETVTRFMNTVHSILQSVSIPNRIISNSHKYHIPN